MVWSGYNTGIERILAPGFGHTPLDFVHGIRAFLPILAGLAAFGFLAVKRPVLPKRFFLTPLGLLSVYPIVGIFSSFFSNRILESLYWTSMYGSVLLVLCFTIFLRDSIKNISSIITVNWIIAGVLSLVLLAFFFFQSGVVSSLDAGSLLCSQRPFESIGGVKAEIDTFGMAGTRPTGLGRYIGITALVLFVATVYEQNRRRKFWWALLFTAFVVALFFSRGRAVLAAFPVAMVFVFWVARKFKSLLVLLLAGILLLSGIAIFYHIPCDKNVNIVDFFKKEFLPKQTSAPALNVALTPGTSPSLPAAPDPAPTSPGSKNVAIISTLSGRTTGVWHDARGLFLDSPLLGRGFHADRFFLNGQHAHNTLLHALIQVGLLGTLPFTLGLFATLLAAFRLLRHAIIRQERQPFLLAGLAVLIFIFVRGVTESFAFYSADWLFLAPVIAYIQIMQLNKEKNEKNSYRIGIF